MSFVFSKVIISPENPSIDPIVRYEGGALDEFDVYDLLKRDPRYAGASFTGDMWDRIRIEHYRFFSSEAKERPGDGDHFAMIQAYDALAAACGAKPFYERDDVQWVSTIDTRVSCIRKKLDCSVLW